MGQTRALTLTGAGGIGKTRLAQRLLADLAGSYHDGVWFVELGDLRQPDLVVSRVAATVGVGEEPGRPPLDTLADALRPRQLLLALDNCEHMVEVCARVCLRLLANVPGLRVVATSREPLRLPGETVWQVPPLAIAPANYIAAPEDPCRYEAIRLFADRAAQCSPGFTVGAANAAAVAAVCRALDGMPLAIELAAARVRALSVDQIAARLADRFALLTNGDRTAPPRQRTLRAAIDWSHDLLTPREQVLLRRLSVFAGWSLEMAEQVCADPDVPEPHILDLIAALMDKSLVVGEPEVLGQARYRMLDTIRDYAAARLADAGESGTFQRRLRDYTVRVAENNHAVGMALVDAPWSARVDVFRRYDADAGNVWQVLSRCLADEDVAAGLRLCTAVRPCWIVRGTFAEGGERLDAFLALDTSAVPPAVLGPAFVGRAQLAMSTGSPPSQTLAEQGLELCRETGDEFWTATAFNLLGEVALHTQHMAEASTQAEAALSIARASGDGWNEGYALGIKATIAALQGKLREAQQLATDSITVMRRIDQQWGVARALLGLGDLARLRGQPADARERYLEALDILREIDARPEIARCLAGLGRVAMDLGVTGQARQYLTESIRLSHSTGARIGVARGLEAFAALAVQENQPELAVQLAAAANALREAAGLPPLSGARVERYLAPGRRLGEPAIARLWAQGLTMGAESAIAQALDGPPTASAEGGTAGPAGGLDKVAATPAVASAVPGVLTPRERQVVTLVASGRSNRAIAEELVISPATVARHVANILAKLGFSSRTQVAVWATDRHLGLVTPASVPGAAEPAALVRDE